MGCFAERRKDIVQSLHHHRRPAHRADAKVLLFLSGFCSAVMVATAATCTYRVLVKMSCSRRSVTAWDLGSEGAYRRNGRQWSELEYVFNHRLCRIRGRSPDECWARHV